MLQSHALTTFWSRWTWSIMTQCFLRSVCARQVMFVSPWRFFQTLPSKPQGSPGFAEIALSLCLSIQNMASSLTLDHIVGTWKKEDHPNSEVWYKAHIVYGCMKGPLCHFILYLDGLHGGPSHQVVACTPRPGSSDPNLLVVLLVFIIFFIGVFRIPLGLPSVLRYVLQGWPYWEH